MAFRTVVKNYRNGRFVQIYDTLGKYVGRARFSKSTENTVNNYLRKNFHRLNIPLHHVQGQQDFIATIEFVQPKDSYLDGPIHRPNDLVVPDYQEQSPNKLRRKYQYIIKVYLSNGIDFVTIMSNRLLTLDDIDNELEQFKKPYKWDDILYWECTCLRTSA